MIAAASKILAKHGSKKTTINKVAAEAGVSRGLLHYYFKNKEELLAEVVRTSEREALEIGEDIFKKSETAEELAANLTNAFRDIMRRNPDHQYLLYEGWVMGRQHPMVAHEVRAAAHATRHSFREGLEDAAARGFISPKVPIEEASLLILAILHGVGDIATYEQEQIENKALWKATEAGILFALTGDP
jgi:AcrR family transcriptional regulator